MRHSTRSEVDPFIVMDVMEAARAAEEAGRDIVHMEVGQPGSGAPQAARDRLAHEMEGGPLGYTVALGRPDLRAAIAALYGEWYDVDLDPARVVLTSARRAASCWRSRRSSTRARRWRWGSRAIPPTARS
jgi:aspartate/methionine/tyrosine aminotransferase